MKESGAHAVKLEGGDSQKQSIERILQAGIPVMGHLGLTPQSIYKFGTYTVRAQEKIEAEKLINDSLLLEEIGCFGIVLEKIPAKLAGKIASKLNIPVIGIGAGKNVDGQVLVVNDMLGMNKEFSPRFLRRYADLDSLIDKAVKNYSDDVKKETFQTIMNNIKLIKKHLIYEDNHLLVYNKQPGVLVQGDKTGDTSLLDILKNYLKITKKKEGNVYLGLVHRLDRTSSGVMVFAKTSKALSRLNKQFKNREVLKTYWAIVEGKNIPKEEKLINWVKKKQKKNKSIVLTKELEGK